MSPSEGAASPCECIDGLQFGQPSWKARKHTPFERKNHKCIPLKSCQHTRFAATKDRWTYKFAIKGTVAYVPNITSPPW